MAKIKPWACGRCGTHVRVEVPMELSMSKEFGGQEVPHDVKLCGACSRGLMDWLLAPMRERREASASTLRAIREREAARVAGLLAPAGRPTPAGDERM